MAYSRRMRSLAGLALLLIACRPATPTAAPTAATPTTVATPVDPWKDRKVDLERLRHHLGFLADDAQEGRAPTTMSPADRAARTSPTARCATARPGRPI